MSCILPQGVSTVQPPPSGSQPTLLVFSIHHLPHCTTVLRLCVQTPEEVQPNVYNCLKINNCSQPDIQWKSITLLKTGVCFCGSFQFKFVYLPQTSAEGQGPGSGRGCWTHEGVWGSLYRLCRSQRCLHHLLHPSQPLTERQSGRNHLTACGKDVEGRERKMKTIENKCRGTKSRL